VARGRRATVIPDDQEVPMGSQDEWDVLDKKINSREFNKIKISAHYITLQSSYVVKNCGSAAMVRRLSITISTKRR